MASIDGVPDADVPSLHVPNSVPILYRFDETSRSSCPASDDVAVAAIVKRIVRHLNMKDDAVCTLADFEASAAHIAHEILHEAKVPARPPPPEDVDLPWGKVQPIHQRDGGDDRSAYG
ncbi:hypothetical protein JL722_4196 [Aureococcus anophagefferens]|nr:hypothetical protein JL722_4196 [Aureococcus anophagefferens]